VAKVSALDYNLILYLLNYYLSSTASLQVAVPGYDADFDAIKLLGVDSVLCLSVNDAFVMYQWGLKQGAKNVKLVPDGACLFTRGMGMSCVWTSERGFGERSWRYSMVVDDMKIEKIFVEPGFQENSGPDPFEVSDSKTMVSYLQSVAVKAGAK
jgi:thioredoxin-dependent peroxiredoxin